MDKPLSSSTGVAARAPGSRPEPTAPRSQARSAYQQRVDQIKVRIVELSHRNMENAMRVLRQWLADRNDTSR
ncbi:MAG: hypothetical protein DBX67_05845 [Desulfovibrionaceae bacterium]|nr:MAG: hypothetical protein DBX67_05845 [Desulfovibrionaceae bacterium]